MQKVLETDPSNVTAHVHLAWALEHLGERLHSKKLIQQIMTLEARSPEELESKSWAARRAGDDGQEEALLHKSSLLDRERPDPHRELARLYKEQGRVAEARGEFEIAVQLGGYENPNEWLEYCALYNNAQPPPICIQGKMELSRADPQVIHLHNLWMQVTYK
jgi:Tfp pilus assembly protein PilF